MDRDGWRVIYGGRRDQMKESIVERGCLGKERHESEAAALAALRFREQERVVRTNEGAGAYECEFCGKWHIGHSRR